MKRQEVNALVTACWCQTAQGHAWRISAVFREGGEFPDVLLPSLIAMYQTKVMQ